MFFKRWNDIKMCNTSHAFSLKVNLSIDEVDSNHSKVTSCNFLTEDNLTKIQFD